MPVAASTMAMLCSEIIFPSPPAAALEAAVSIGLRCSVPAVMTCRLPKSAFEEVSLPVTNTPSQPRNALKKGNSQPVAAQARPSVAIMPE